MTRTRRVIQGLGVSYVSHVVLALVGLLVTPFLLRRLGQEQYGLWLVATQLLAYLALTDLGIVALLPREVAVTTGRVAAGNEHDDLPIVIGHTLRIVFWQLPLVTLVALGFWIFLPAEWEPLRDPLAIVLTAYLLTFPLRVTTATLSGLQDLAFLGALQTVAIIAGAATTVVVVMARPGLMGLAVGWTVTQLTLGGIGWLRLRRRFPAALPTRLPHLTAAAFRERFGRSVWVLVSQVAVVLLNATDTVIIGKVLGAAAVVPYVCTARLIQFLAGQPQLLMLTAQPGLAELRARESPPRVLRAASAVTQAALIASGAIACGVVVVNYGFVQLWVGGAQWGGLGLTVLILFRTLLSHWNLSTGSAIFAFGYERRLALVGIADGILFVLVTTLLVERLGVIGVPLAGILTASLLQLPLNLSALARETGTTVLLLVTSLLPWAWRFAIAFGFAGVLAVMWRPVRVHDLLVAGVVAVSVYALLMVRRVQEPPLSLYLHPRLLGLLLKLPQAIAGARAMTGQPLVSALVAVYNEEPHLGECLESLRAQSYEPLEIIVADDGSTDGSAMIARRVPGVRLITGTHRGKAQTMNAAAERAAGEILLFLDGDLYFDPEYVGCLVQPIVEGRAIGACHATERVANPKNAWARCWQHRAGLPPDQRLRLSSAQLAEGSPIYRALRADLFQLVGGFEDTGYTDDQTLYPKLRQRAVFVEDAVCYHYNVETLDQVFGQGVWGGKSMHRQFGARALLRYLPPLTLLRALRTLFRDRPGTLALYDLTVETGMFWGVLSRSLRLDSTYGR